MIVVDTNVVAYLYLPNELTGLSESLLRRDPDWAAPVLWKSEFRNVLALYLQKGLLDFDQAYAIQLAAEELLSGSPKRAGARPTTASSWHSRSTWARSS